MNKKIIIDANFPNETRVVLLNQNNNIEDIEYETAAKQQNKGNIYLAKVTRVEPSLQAAFIDYGTDKSGFLPFSEIHPDYYHIPVSDQKLTVNNLQEIALPDITSDDLAESKTHTKYNPLLDNDEIDLKVIEKYVDEKIQSEFNLEIADTEIETISNDVKGNIQQKQQYKIQEVIKKGQILLVQLTKEERGNKGASFTTYISIAGKYCVLMPNTPAQNGVSRKISNADERKRLKAIISKFIPNETNSTSSIIVRTAGTGCTTLDIKRDYDYLVRLWNKIRDITLKSIAPCFIHEEEGIIQKTIRDMLDYSVKELIVQGRLAYQNAMKFMQDILPTELRKLKEYQGKAPIFTKFGIEEQLSNLYQPIASLPSGGYIVINPTEALISIDVNSGKATSERNIEETALKTNLEAAKEIARQVKLRDLSGLLVIDFIDMYEARNRKLVERTIKEFLSRDRARIQTTNISQFGLLEMSRQRLRPSFLESNSAICSYCNGKGIVRADESNSMLILRTIENEIYEDAIDIVNVFANIASVIYLLNNKRQEILLIEQKYNLKLNFYSDPLATSDNYSIEKIKLPKKHISSVVHNHPAVQNNAAHYQEVTKFDDADKIKGTAANATPTSGTIQEIGYDKKHKYKWKTNSKAVTSTTLDNIASTKPQKEDNTIAQTTILENNNLKNKPEEKQEQPKPNLSRKHINRKSPRTRPTAKKHNYNKPKAKENSGEQV